MDKIDIVHVVLVSVIIVLLFISVGVIFMNNLFDSIDTKQDVFCKENNGEPYRHGRSEYFCLIDNESYKVVRINNKWRLVE